MINITWNYSPLGAREKNTGRFKHKKQVKSQLLNCPLPTSAFLFWYIIFQQSIMFVAFENYCCADVKTRLEKDADWKFMMDRGCLLGEFVKYFINCKLMSSSTKLSSLHLLCVSCFSWHLQPAGYLLCWIDSRPPPSNSRCPDPYCHSSHRYCHSSHCYWFSSHCYWFSCCPEPSW